MQTNKFLQTLDDAEIIGAEVASKLAPWLAPLLSSVVVAQAVTGKPFEWSWWQAVLLGATVELMGLATLSTAMMIYSHRQQQADNKPPLTPLLLALAGVVVYMATVAAITVLLKVPVLTDYAEWISPLVFVGILMLAITASVNLTVRRDHYRLVHPQKSAQTGRRRKPTNKRPADQTREEKLANLDRANDARRPTQADYNYAARLRGEGYTWPEVAGKINRSPSTAKTWAGKASQQPVSANGAGGTL